MTSHELLRQRLGARLARLVTHYRRAFKHANTPLYKELVGDALRVVAGRMSGEGVKMEDLRSFDLNAAIESHGTAGPTPQAAIAAVERDAEHLVASTADELRAVAEALVAPEFLDAVMRREEVARLWPWGCAAESHARTSDDIPGCVALTELRDRCPEPLEAEDGPTRDWWRAYGDESPANLRRWAASRLNEDADPDAGPPGLVTPPALKRLPDGTAIEWVHVAILYHAERAVQAVTPQRLFAPALDVQRSTVRTFTSLGGAHPELLAKEGAASLSRRRQGDEEGPELIVFRWDDGTKQQLDLPLDDDLGTSPLLLVGRHYGPSVVRELLGLYSFAWANQADATAFWWFPDEHLRLVGLEDTKDNRRSLGERMTLLHRTRLEAHYSDGKPLIGPLVSLALTDGTARKVGIHPALYRGVRASDGKRGEYFWPIPLDLLKLHAKGENGRVHTLAVVAGMLFRANLRERAVESPRIRVGRLAEHLAVQGRKGESARRLRDERMGETLKSTLDAGVACDLLGSYHLEIDGRKSPLASLANPEAVVVFTPGREARAIIATGRHPYPTYCPATGEELVRWLAHSGQSASEAARWLGLPAHAVQRASAYGARPLPTRVRGALRARLWGALPTGRDAGGG
jgi:hypothetical protein